MRRLPFVPVALAFGIALVALVWLLTATAYAQSSTVAKLLASGGTGQKWDVVVIGDGFQAGSDQTAFDNWVNNELVNGVFARGPFWEDMNAFNLYRVNTFSQDSGLTVVDQNGKVTTARSTALDYRVSGIWSRCWNEPGPNTDAALQSTLSSLAPGWEYAIIVLNDPSAGGCRRGNTLAVGINEDWHTLQHEMGHMIGNLCDEYVGGSSPGSYTGSEPGCVNLTTNTNRETLKWGAFVDPNTPIVTAFNAATMDETETAGAFAGGTLGMSGYSSGIWRPTSNGTMRFNHERFGAVDYNRIKEVDDQFHEYTYQDAYGGDFNGDDRNDLVIQNANSLALYLSDGQHMRPAWIRTGELGNWDGIADGDRFYVADFDGDGRDDLYVVNFTNWSMPYFGMLRSTGSGFEALARYDNELPGWGAMKPHDTFFVADFDGDKREDLYVFNGQDWSDRYLLMLRSTGTELQYVQRYDKNLPGWDEMKPSDTFAVADFDGNGKDDLYVSNLTDWSMGYLGLLRSTGSALELAQRFDDTLPDWDKMRPNDRFTVLDYDGSGTEDLVVFNAKDWGDGYLEILRADAGGLSPVRRYDKTLPGWDVMKPGDTFYAADVNGDHKQDLYVYNAGDWDSEYLGILLSDGGGGLNGSWQKDWIGGWNLGSADRFVTGDYSGGQGGADIVVRNDDWLGLLRSNGQALSMDAIYLQWIHDYRYHRYGLW